MILSETELFESLASLAKRYLQEDEKHLESEAVLSSAYELGRKAIRSGLSELDVLTVYHEVIGTLDVTDLNNKEQLQKVTGLLKEVLMPYVFQHGGYTEVVKNLKNTSYKLDNEIGIRKSTQTELERAKEFHRTLTENIQDVITIIDDNCIIRYGSPSIYPVFGHPREELIGRPFLDLLHSNDRDLAEEIFKKALSDPHCHGTIEVRARNSAGEWRYLEGMVTRFVDPSPFEGLLITSRDITERRAMEERLRERDKILRAAQRLASVGSWEWSPGVDRFRWSEGLCAIYRRPSSQDSSTIDDFLKYVHPADREDFRAIIINALETKTSFEYEHRVTHTDGQTVYIKSIGEVLVSEDDGSEKIIGTEHDVTEYKEKEEKIVESRERLRRLSARLERLREEERKSVARDIHDNFGQLLVVLKMDVNILRSKVKRLVGAGALNAEFSNIANVIDLSVGAVQRITSELRPELLDQLGLIDAMEWLVKEYNKRGKIGIAFDRGGIESVSMADEKATAVFRIFQEAMTNAFRHSGANEMKISLTVEGKGNGSRAGQFLMQISDDGVGISDAEVNGFESHGITGMKERAYLIGGQCEISCGEKNGTRVLLEVPLDQG